jgi:hypothetical protein
MKTCTVCKQSKAFDEFPPSAKARDGLYTQCRTCKKAKSAESYQRNKEQVKARTNAYHHANRDARNAASRAKYAANPGPKRAANLAWNKANPEAAHQWERANRDKVAEKSRRWHTENKERHAANGKAWRERNPQKNAATAAKRRAAKLQRTPKWLTPADFLEIQMLYDFAKGMELATGIPHHVDHILPLQGEFVSGLHVLANLQILTAFENTSKGPRWQPE